MQRRGGIRTNSSRLRIYSDVLSLFLPPPPPQSHIIYHHASILRHAPPSRRHLDRLGRVRQRRMSHLSTSIPQPRSNVTSDSSRPTATLWKLVNGSMSSTLATSTLSPRCWSDAKYSLSSPHAIWWMRFVTGWRGAVKSFRSLRSNALIAGRSTRRLRRCVFADLYEHEVGLLM